VNGSMVAAFSGKPVVLVGRVKSSEAGRSVLVASVSCTYMWLIAGTSFFTILSTFISFERCGAQDGQEVSVQTQAESLFAS